MKFFLTLFLCLLFQVQVVIFAQDNDSIDYKTLDETIILDDYLNTSIKHSNREVQIIDKNTIEKLPVRTIDEVLRYAIGIDIRQRGAAGVQTDVTIDGGTFDQCMVLLNGMIVTDAQTGHNMMFLPINLTDIERIEIIRGSAASLYGVNALLGAINIVTKKQHQNAYNIHANGGLAMNGDTTSNNYHDYLLSSSANVVLGKWQQLLSAQYANGNGYQHNSAFKHAKLFYQGNIDASDQTNIYYQLGYVNSDFGANGFYAAPGDANAHENVTSYIAMAQLKQAITKNWNASLKYGYQYKLDDYKYQVNPLLGNNIHKNNTHQLEWNNKIFSQFGNINIGLAIRNETINSTNLGDRNRMNLGLFGGYQKTFRLLQFKLHVYANSNSDYGIQLYPGMDIGGKINKNNTWFLNAGMGQRLPTFTDLYYKQANLIIGNPNLKPEQSVSVSMGWEYKKNDEHIRALVFYRTVDQFIDWVKNEPTDPWQPNNFQTLQTVGFTVSYGNSIPFTNSLLRKLDYKLSYNYLQPTITDNEMYLISRYALNNLKHQFIGITNFYFSENFILSPSIRYNERISYKDYLLINLRVAYTNKYCMFYVDADNIFNEKVVEAGANQLPGFWMRLGAQFKF